MATVVVALAVLASAASARAIDTTGFPAPQGSSSQHSAPASSDGTGAASVAGLLAGGIVLVVGGVLVFDAAAKRLVRQRVRLHR